MVAPQGPAAKTSSRCTPATARATHAFEIAGYSLHKGLGSGKCICSATFSVGGHEWRILYYPDGYTKEDNEEYVSVFVQLIGEGGEVRAQASGGGIRAVHVSGLKGIANNIQGWYHPGIPKVQEKERAGSIAIPAG
ncbi:hypothetical protein ACQ4PT_031742 [Festuca glaucescens]